MPKTPLQKLIELNVTNGQGYNTETPSYQGSVKSSFFRLLYTSLIEEDNSENKLKAHLSHLSYLPFRRYVLDVCHLLKNAPDDYEFLFNNGDKKELNSQQRRKEKRKLIKMAKSIRTTRDHHLKKVQQLEVDQIRCISAIEQFQDYPSYFQAN